MIAWRLEQYDSLQSTSDSCILRAKAGEPEGLAVLAFSQTSGRGSRGRKWESASGNLSLSVLLRPTAPSSIFPLLAGVAVADAVCAFLPADIAPVLKWPNDVLLGGAKLAGILVDAVRKDDSTDWLVIGIGINLAVAPEIPGRRTTTLSAYGGKATPTEAARMVLDFLSQWLEVTGKSGAAPIIDAWLQRAHRIGTELQLKTADKTITGRFVGLSATGELLLTVAHRIERFSTGEILMGVGG